MHIKLLYYGRQSEGVPGRNSSKRSSSQVSTKQCFLLRRFKSQVSTSVKEWTWKVLSIVNCQFSYPKREVSFVSKRRPKPRNKPYRLCVPAEKLRSRRLTACHTALPRSVLALLTANRRNGSSSFCASRKCFQPRLRRGLDCVVKRFLNIAQFDCDPFFESAERGASLCFVLLFSIGWTWWSQTKNSWPAGTTLSWINNHEVATTTTTSSSGDWRTSSTFCWEFQRFLPRTHRCIIELPYGPHWWASKTTH